MKPTVRLGAVVLTLMAVAAAVPSSGAAQQGPGNGERARDNAAAANLVAQPLASDMSIRLDGVIEEEAWALTTPITDFTQQEPVEGGEPSERTEVRVTFDEDNLYIGAIIYDDPEGILAYQRERDAGLGTDDRFMWILDTFLDGRTGYFFEINAAGLMGDGILTGGGGRGGFGGGGGGGTNKAWDGIWEARTERRPDGWSAEIRIPFRTLNFDPELDTWGINFQRTIRRRNEEILWRGYRRNEGLFRPVYAGRLTGLQNLSQGLGLEAVPSTIASWRNVPADTLGALNPTTYPRDLSLDVNYSVTSSLRASVSVNTDFAEVESDQRRVNLTRFPIRFPERRDFFLEGSSVFSFAPRSGPSPFYSRNVGLRSGQQIPITYGARMVGQVGKYQVGFYQLGTDQHSFLAESGGIVTPDTLASENFTVARVKRQILEQSTIGAIYTRRATATHPTTGELTPDRHTAGVDLAFNTRNLLGSNNMEIESFVIWNSNPDPATDLTFQELSAHGLRINFPNDIWSGHISYRAFGDDYRPAAGFVNRNNFWRLEPRIGWSPRPEGIDWIRRLSFSAQYRHLAQQGSGLLDFGSGTVEEREWTFNVLGVDFESGDGFDINATHTFEYLDRDFDISDGVTIAGGDYNTWNYRLSGRTTGRRKVSIFGNASYGDFWNGERLNFGGRMTFRPRPGVSVSSNIQRNDVRLPQGNFTADVYEIETDLNPSPWTSWTGQIRYDSQSQLVGLFARLRWIITPGNDLFLVYSHNWDQIGAGILDDRHLVTRSRGGSVKLNYTYRF